MMQYSVAIRTLGTSPESLYKELVSIHAQSIQPKEIIIYIARGYPRPEFTVGKELYVEVDKGMVSQRALDYQEISTKYILLLDDDVHLGVDSAEILLHQLKEYDADCVAADTFANHQMSLFNKIKAAVGNFVFPRFSQNWAFKLHSNGSFSYINNVKRDIYPSQSAAGPCSLWRKDSLLALRLHDEKWLDSLGFSFGDDELEFYKLHINGGNLFVSFSSNVINMDSKSSSAVFQQNKNKFYVRAMSNFIRWYRIHYEPQNGVHRSVAVLSFAMKYLWQAAIHAMISVCTADITPIRLFICGLFHGISFVKSDNYNVIPKYKNEDIVLR